MDEETTMTGRSKRLLWVDSLTVLDSPTVVLRYHQAAKIVHHEVRQFLHGEAFRELLESGLELIERHKATKWLSDDRCNGPIKPADAEWSLKHWVPRARAAGWKHWAVVLPEKVLGQMNMKRFIENCAETGQIAQGFTDPLQAMRWLEAQ